MRTYPPGVTGPPPLWALSAEHNAAHMALVRHQKAAAAAVSSLVTHHPVPWSGEPVTAAARTLERLAGSRGMTTRLGAGSEGCTLEGRLDGQRVGFRAVWRRGRADAAWWFEPAARWGMADDPRPGPDATVTRTVKGREVRAAHPNRMPRGLDRHHLVLLGGPDGVLIPFAQLSARVRALG